MKSIILSPSLDTTQNVSGISSVTQFIISNNTEVEYIHFELGRKDNERKGVFRFKAIWDKLKEWKKVLKKHPDTMIHYNFPLSAPSILRDSLFIFTAWKLNRKMIIHIHGGSFLTAPRIPFVLKSILNAIFSLPVPFIVLSEIEKKIVHETFNCKQINVLPNCVDLKDAVGFKRNKPHEAPPLVIGYLGRIAETKGMGYLLQACEKLQKENIPFVVKLAGKEEEKGQYLDLYDAYLHSSFVYAGTVSGKEKNDFISSLDIFALPSYFEGLPMSLLECMSYGVVPLTTNVGSIGDVVTDGKNGLFIQIRDSNTIVEQIKRLHTDRLLLEKLSSAAKKTILQNFNPTQYIQTLNDIYKQA